MCQFGIENEDGEDDHGIGRGVAVLVLAFKRPFIRLGDEDFGRSIGVAFADEVYDVEGVKSPNRTENDRGHESGFEERESDMSESLPCTGAVDGGGIFEIARNGLQSAERDDHHEGKSEPCIRREVSGKRSQELAVPIDLVETEGCEDVVDGAEFGVEHAAPDEGCDVVGDCPRHDEQDAI